MRRKLRDADEQDAFTGWRRFYRWKPGQLRKIKRRSSKYERQAAKRIEDMCCICSCAHAHEDTGVIPRDSCVMCKWCTCHQHARGVDKVGGDL